MPLFRGYVVHVCSGQMKEKDWIRPIRRPDQLRFLFFAQKEVEILVNFTFNCLPSSCFSFMYVCNFFCPLELSGKKNFFSSFFSLKLIGNEFWQKKSHNIFGLQEPYFFATYCNKLPLTNGATSTERERGKTINWWNNLFFVKMCQIT